MKRSKSLERRARPSLHPDEKVVGACRAEPDHASRTVAAMAGPQPAASLTSAGLAGPVPHEGGSLALVATDRRLVVLRRTMGSWPVVAAYPWEQVRAASTGAGRLGRHPFTLTFADGSTASVVASERDDADHLAAAIEERAAG